MRIVLTDNAKFTLQTIFDSIESRFSPKRADTFLLEVEKTLLQVSKNSEIFKATPLSENVRIRKISKQTSFYYQINNNTVVVLYFWDNRQDPISF